MTARVVRSPAARVDVARIAAYISEQSGSRTRAQRFVEQLERKLQSYARQPLMGELRDDLGADLRSCSFKRNYVVIYRPIDHGIDVLRVFHSAQDYPRLFDAGE